MVISQLMNNLEITINFKKNCKTVSNFNFFHGITLFQAIAPPMTNKLVHHHLNATRINSVYPEMTKNLIKRITK